MLSFASGGGIIIEQWSIRRNILLESHSVGEVDCGVLHGLGFECARIWTE